MPARQVMIKPQPTGTDLPARRDIETIASWIEDWCWEGAEPAGREIAARLRAVAVAWIDDDERTRIAAEALRAMLHGEDRK